MSHRFEEELIRHCAATLAGHKCGSLFFCQKEGETALGDNLRSANAQLEEKGVRACLLREGTRGGLVYVYRPAMLEGRLRDTEVRVFLAGQGYCDPSAQECLRTLSAHMACGEEFPHEIGVFLDYPLSDVMAFIENGGDHCQCVGCWKVYSNVEQAQRLFALYRKCRDVYLRCYARGFSVSRLTIAA